MRSKTPPTTMPRSSGVGPPSPKVRWRGSFGYLTALIEQDGPDERVPLCRIE
ncbi:hypothetical protein [Streptomyces sp. NBC_01589]|uniref:hypothetical protein n=1 Tax=unclassified Streptomyces TaxID=2593676 RepID=UPI003864B748